MTSDFLNAKEIKIRIIMNPALDSTDIMAVINTGKHLHNYICTAIEVSEGELPLLVVQPEMKNKDA